MNINDLKKKYDFSIIPKELKISTLSVCCKLNVDINLKNLYEYTVLDNELINSIKYSDNIKTLLKKKKNKKQTKVFYNQITMSIWSNSSKKNINLKLFKNGSVQMSGCKHIIDCVNVLNILNTKLTTTYAIMENNNVVDVPFIIDNKKINITDFKIILINSNFKIPYLIKREILYNILVKKEITCRYEPCIHACVNIKFFSDFNKTTKPVSIFVFQSGNIIITGAKTIEVIPKAYDYIKGIINEHLRQIIKKDINIIS